MCPLRIEISFSKRELNGKRKTLYLIEYNFLSNKISFSELSLFSTSNASFSSLIVSLRFYLFFNLFLERGEGREKERERNIRGLVKHQTVAFPMLPTRYLTCNPGSDLELNSQPTEPYQPGPFSSFILEC